MDLAIVAALSLAAVAPLFVFDPAVAHVTGGDVIPLLRGAAPLLFLLPLPAAYVASISRDGFRVESLAAVVILPLGVFGLRFTAVAAGLVLGLPLVSYKARSIYTGDNAFWTWFKSSAALVTVLAVVLGISAAYAYNTSPALRQDVQGNVTDRAVGTATQFVDLSQEGLSPDRITGATARLARNISSTSLALTEKTVFAAVEEDGTFSDGQRQVLRDAFTQAEEEIPGQLSQQAQQRVTNQLAGGENVQRSLIRSRMGPIVERLSKPTPPVLALIFFTVLSLAYLVKFPVALLGGVYGLGFRRLRHRYAEREDTDPRQRARERRRDRQERGGQRR